MPHLERTDPLSAKIGAGQHHPPRAGRQVLRLQHRRRRHRRPARKPHVAPRRQGPRPRCRRCRPRRRLRSAATRAPKSSSSTAPPKPPQKLAKQSGAKTIKREAVAKTRFDVIINATPSRHGRQQGRATPRSRRTSTPSFVFDLVYNPLETPLLRLARQQRHPRHHRRRDVRSAGRPPVRNLDRQARSRRRDAARRPPRPAPAGRVRGGIPGASNQNEESLVALRVKTKKEPGAIRVLPFKPSTCPQAS